MKNNDEYIFYTFYKLLDKCALNIIIVLAVWNVYIICYLIFRCAWEWEFVYDSERFDHVCGVWCVV